MKKIILLVLMLFAVGCTAKYDLTIEGKNITENLSLSSEISDVNSKENLYADYLDEYPIFEDEEFLYYAPTEKIEGVEYYEKSIIETDYGYNATYKASFNFDDLERSRLLNTAFINYNIGYNKSENYYYIIAQNIKLFDYDNNITKLEISIDIGDYEVVESNATSVVGSLLSWNFIENDNNSTDRIILEYREKQETITENPTDPDNSDEEENNENNETSMTDILLVVGSLIGFIIILILIIILSKKKHK